MTIFVISDMHSFLTLTLEALKNAGWDENNPDHKIVVCGDAFDRGNETAEMLEWILDLIDKDKLIYVKGNHDILMQQMLNRGYSMMHDKHNGTEKSYYQLLNSHAGMMNGGKPEDIVKELLQPLYDNMVNYLETKNYIFVHSWIPLINKDGLPAYYTKGRKFDFNPNWRKASQQDWDDAMWGNPFDLAEQGFLPDRTVIFGHWHCSTGWAKAEGHSEFGEDAIFEPYYGDGFISIDACTAYSGKVNVLVLEDEFLED